MQSQENNNEKYEPGYALFNFSVFSEVSSVSASKYQSKQTPYKPLYNTGVTSCEATSDQITDVINIIQRVTVLDEN
jgi:hypothetical protein